MSHTILLFAPLARVAPPDDPPPLVNGLTLLVLLALVIGIVVAWRAGIAHGRRTTGSLAPTALRPAATYAPTPAKQQPPAVTADPNTTSGESVETAVVVECARLVRSLEAEAAALRRSAVTNDAERAQLRTLAAERQQLFRELAQARGHTARYRQLVIDLEDDALPPLLDGPNTPDDLKLIVGVGPVLERMLQQLGIATYRQIARWTERDIDDFDARLPEFPGRIRRDAWVTQARELHYAKYGETLAPR